MATSTTPPRDLPRDRCGLTRSDGKPCQNPPVGDLEVCVRHVRERATLLRLANGLDSDGQSDAT